MQSQHIRVALAAVRFLTQTFCNVFYVCVGKRYICLWRLLVLANHRLRRLAVRRKLEDAGYRRLWHRRHAPPVRKPNPNLEPATSAGVVLPETGEFLSLCSLQLWQQLQHCRQTRARVPLFFYILLPFCGNSLLRTTCFLGK